MEDRKFSIDVSVNFSLSEEQKTKIIMSLGEKLKEIVGEMKFGTVIVYSKKE